MQSPLKMDSNDAVDELLNQILKDDGTEDEQLCALHRAIVDNLDLPMDAGDYAEADKILNELCQADLRCLDAHAHLGNREFDRRPKQAIRHFEVGLRIGELPLPPDYDGILLWGHINNRPFLRCMHGYGLSCWRLGRVEEARQIFERLLQLNPLDNQGIRFLIEDINTGKSWEDQYGESS